MAAGPGRSRLSGARLNRRALLAGLAALPLSAQAAQPRGVRPALFQAGLAALDRFGGRRDRLALVDFAEPSSAPRLFLVDLAADTAARLLTAHGKGSDPAHTGRATIFSNESGSNASSLGAYRCAERYHGVHGLSLRLDGLEPTNDAARPRAIVLHSAVYMDAPFRAQHGKPGRSFGCFVTETAAVAATVDWLEGGVLLVAGT